MEEQDFYNTIALWSDSDKNQRLGQFLMNTLKPTEVNARIFYTESDLVAALLFYRAYVL